MICAGERLRLRVTPHCDRQRCRSSDSEAAHLPGQVALDERQLLMLISRGGAGHRRRWSDSAARDYAQVALDERQLLSILSNMFLCTFPAPPPRRAGKKEVQRRRRPA